MSGSDVESDQTAYFRPSEKDRLTGVVRLREGEMSEKEGPRLTESAEESAAIAWWDAHADAWDDQDVEDLIAFARSQRSPESSSEVMQDDMTALMKVLGISVHARPCSPHEVMVNEIIPAVRALVACDVCHGPTQDPEGRFVQCFKCYDEAHNEAMR